MVEDSDIEEGVMSPRALSGATALAISEAAPLQRLPSSRQQRCSACQPEADTESATDIIVIHTYEKEETITTFAKTGPAELKRTVVISEAGVTAFSRQILVTEVSREIWNSSLKS